MLIHPSSTLLIPYDNLHQVTSMGTRVTVLELVKLLQLTAAPPSSTPTSTTTTTSDIFSAMTASLAVTSFTSSSSSSSPVPPSPSASVRAGAGFAKGGRTAAQTVFPLVDNTDNKTSSSSSSSDHHTPPRHPSRPSLKLVGSVHRRDVFLYLQTLFAQADQLGLRLAQSQGGGRLSLTRQRILSHPLTQPLTHPLNLLSTQS